MAFLQSVVYGSLWVFPSYIFFVFCLSSCDVYRVCTTKVKSNRNFSLEAL